MVLGLDEGGVVEGDDGGGEGVGGNRVPGSTAPPPTPKYAHGSRLGLMWLQELEAPVHLVAVASPRADCVSTSAGTTPPCSHQ